MDTPNPQFTFVSPANMVPQGPIGPLIPPDLIPAPNPANEQSSPFAQLVVSPLFVDNLAKDFGLTVVQRSQLHICAQLGSVGAGLTKADLSTRLFSLAVFYTHSTKMERAAEQSNMNNVAQLLDDLRVRLDDDYRFTKEQMRNIRTQAQDTIYEATRTSFMMMHHDVLEKLRDNKTSMKLTSVFGNPSREKSLVSVVKKTCSSVRNSLRQDIRNSICGDAPATLATFTYVSATKFKRGGPGPNLDVGFSIHNAILRRFAMENPAIIGVEEVEADEEDNIDEGSPEPPSKKRKLSATTHAGGRIPKGKDFWSRVDAFFAQKIKDFGSKNLQNAGWKEFTAETVQNDERLFRNQDEPVEMTVAVPPSSTSRNDAVSAGSVAPANGGSSLLALL
ncbi:hypothetical protein B0H11DRAFT_2226324 [Mycena galericulata]|nr:hypothetical protein B0H11DRAFT_2226324 [Mycena galericulata]